MYEAHTINAQYKDLIHDVAYSYYGNLMATCSNDQTVKVTSHFVYFTSLFILFRQKIINIFFKGMGNWNLSANLESPQRTSLDLYF